MKFKLMIASGLALSLGMASVALAAPSGSGHGQQSLSPRTSDFSFSTVDGLRLVGKVTMPVDTHGPVPVVVFFGGSGSWDSDYVHKGHVVWPLAAFADRCAAEGMAFVRYQKRGVDDPGGTVNAAWKTSQLHNLIADAQTVLSKVKKDPRFDSHRIALVGHSEGTSIATWIGGTDPDVKAFSFMGVVYRNMRDITRYQEVDLQLEVGFDGVDLNHDGFLDAEEIAKAEKKGMAYGDWRKELDTSHDDRLARGELSSALESGYNQFLKEVETASADAEVNGMMAGWWQDHFRHEPLGQSWKRIKTPVLILQGKLDQNTPYQTEALPFMKQLAAQHHPDFQLKSYEGLDHLFRDEQGTSHASQVIADEVSWLKKHLQAATSQ